MCSQNERVALHLGVHYLDEGEERSVARSSSLPSYEEEELVEAAYSLLAADHGGKAANMAQPSQSAGPTRW